MNIKCYIDEEEVSCTTWLPFEEPKKSKFLFQQEFETLLKSFLNQLGLNQ